ncbi:MAG: hypothetical protein R3185_07990 [Candidatus Thermoplasmatota archaeon]|nr:hypothetical protein [Candidatus Thermoplasmatota archaeon]
MRRLIVPTLLLLLILGGCLGEPGSPGAEAEAPAPPAPSILLAGCTGAGMTWEISPTWASEQLDDRFTPRLDDGGATLGLYVLSCPRTEVDGAAAGTAAYATWWIPVEPTGPAPSAQEYQWHLAQVHAEAGPFSAWWQARGIPVTFGTVDAEPVQGPAGTGSLHVGDREGEVDATLAGGPPGTFQRDVVFAAEGVPYLTGWDDAAAILSGATVETAGTTWHARAQAGEIPSQAYTIEALDAGLQAPVG